MDTGTIIQFPGRRQQSGFTLVETMITLTIASILLTAAVPSMQDFITRNRMSTEVNTFISSLYLARSEAVKRMQNVGLCPSVDYTSCTNSPDPQWNIGWMVYANKDSTSGFDPSAGDEILQRNPSLPSRFMIKGTISFITYNPTGQSNAGNYIFCDTGTGNVAQDRKVTVSSEGRVRVDQLATTGTGCS